MNTKLLALLICVTACGKDRGSDPPAKERQWYRGALIASDGEIPFLLEAPTPDHEGTVVIESGADRIARPARWTGTELHVEFPIYQTEVTAQLDPTGTLRGTFASHSRTWGSASLPLIATPIEKPDIAALATVASGTPIDLGEAHTMWRVELVEEGVARLELDQPAPGTFEGTVTFSSGNTSFLAGTGRDDRIVLTAFDGASPSRLTLELTSDRKLGNGEWLSGQNLDWRERFTATRSADVPLASTQPLPRGQKMTLPLLADFAGKPMIVELAGSWCSSCKNAAPVLRTIHDEYKARGLEIVTLLYELTDDGVANREQADVFKKTYEIPWQVIAMPGDAEDISSIMPPGLADASVSGFPIALFLDREHTLVAMHAGFPVAGTRAHQEAVANYRENTELITAGK